MPPQSAAATETRTKCRRCQTKLAEPTENKRSAFCVSGCHRNTAEHVIVERDDGKFQVGLADDAAGPFETRQFAEAVMAAHQITRIEWLRKNSRHQLMEGS